MKAYKTHLPPNCGADLAVPLLHNPYQSRFMQARRMRICLVCKSQGFTNGDGQYICAGCNHTHVDNMTAPRIFDRLLVLAGRGGGKTLIGAHAAREEMMVPNGIGWVMGPTYKILHDSTFPTLVRLIPPDWIKRWDPEHMEITLRNGHLIAFRSLEDPERARGPHGVTWGWFDEAAQCPERAYDVFEPTLIRAGGIIFATTTVLGFDWTYEKLEKRAFVYKEPGYWVCKYWTEENPLFRSSPVMRAQIERARKTMSPEFYAQEYRAERRNAAGLVYSYDLIEKQKLRTASEVQRYLPEWPKIDPSRPVIIGLDSGVDHPFGAAKLVAVPQGLIVVADYLERRQALTQHLTALPLQLGLIPHLSSVKWAANKNEANLRLEFGLKGIGVIPAESKQEIGIQRVQSWLHAGQLFFAYTAPRTSEQMQSYRYVENLASDGQKKREMVFKQKDELPDAVRYALMAWPELPRAEESAMSESEKQRWETMSDQQRDEIERMRAYTKQLETKELAFGEDRWPWGTFWGADDGQAATW